MRRLLDISVVVIGRNEGARLERCLASVQAADWQGLSHELIYVDSHSSDGSPMRALAMGAEVLGLGGARPCAAAGRNVGWRAAAAPLVLFLDGDTVLDPQFVQRALPALADPAVAAVWGHRRELDPQQSIYTEVLDLDWVFAPGRVDYFGGDVLVRREVLEQLGGFDGQLVAGEEPEFCWRLRRLGWQIEHIDAPMTGHDLGIRNWQGWWRHAERAGLAYAQVSNRYAQTDSPLWRREARRNQVQGLLLLAWLPLLVALLALWPAAALGQLGLTLALWWRSARRCRWKCPEQAGLAWRYALHSQLQQLPILFGQWRWWELQRSQQLPQLIEYRNLAERTGSKS